MFLRKGPDHGTSSAAYFTARRVRERGPGKRTGRKTETAPRADFHHDTLGRHATTGAEDFTAKVITALERLARLPQLIRAFFGDPNLRYITA